MARLALYTLKYIDKSAGYKHDLFSDGPDFNMTNFWADRQPVFTQADGTQVKWGDVSFAITVGGEVIAGDVNSDGRVDGLDVVTLARHLVGEDPVPFNAAAANVNGDDGISIADVAGVIEISRSRNLEMAPSKYRNIEITK